MIINPSLGGAVRAGRRKGTVYNRGYCATLGVPRLAYGIFCYHQT